MEKKIVAIGRHKDVIAQHHHLVIVELENGWLRRGRGLGYLKITAEKTSGHINIIKNADSGFKIIETLDDDSDDPDLFKSRLKEKCLEFLLKEDEDLLKETFFDFIEKDSWLCSKGIMAIWQRP